MAKKHKNKVKERHSLKEKLQGSSSSFSTPVFVRYESSGYTPNKSLTVSEIFLNVARYLIDKNFKEKQNRLRLEREATAKQERHKALVKFLKDELVRDTSHFLCKYIQVDKKFEDVLEDVIHDRSIFLSIQFEILEVNNNYTYYDKNIPHLLKCTRMEDKYEDEDTEETEEDS